MKGLLDPQFKYIHSSATDIRKRFDEVREKIKQEQQRSEAILQEAQKVVAKTRIRAKT